MSKYFGTDGFRGEVNKVLTVEHAYKIGRFLGWYYGKEHKCKVVIGKDTRRSGYMLESALCAGLTASGADAYLMHVTSTPSVSYITRVDDFDCGVMISASHNKFYDNGIKLINCDGEKMQDDVIDEVEKYIDGAYEIPYAEREKIGRTVDYAEGRNRYVGYLISLAKHSFKGIKVGLDCSNGSTWQIAKSVFDALGADTYVINNKPDGININENCGSTHIEVLRDYVLENKLDVGFAFDGDADRCLAVAEDGRIINGDIIIYICGKYLAERNQLTTGKVVTTIMSNMGLYKALKEAGIGYEQTNVGDKYVYENMKANGHLIGGEESGHIIFSKYATTGDGLMTALQVMEVMLDSKQSLTKLGEPVRFFPQKLQNVRVKDKNAVMEDDAVLKEVERVTKELGDDGRLLLRKSGTEPVIRVMVEASSMETCEKYVGQMVDMLKEKGYTE